MKDGIARRGQPAVPKAWRNCLMTPAMVTASACIRSHVTALTEASSISRAASQAMVAEMSSTATDWNGVDISFCGRSSGKAASARSMALPP